MDRNRGVFRAAPAWTRRRFVQGLGGSTLALAGVRGWASGTSTVLSGTEFDLEIGAREVNFTGKTRPATVVNGQLPAPLLRWREGDTVTLRVSNRLSVPSSIHWHGVIVPADMDGVPGLSFRGIGPGQTYVYRFQVNQSGTYWYHSHTRFQEQTGLYGPIVIEPRGAERHRTERDYVVLLSDWTDSDPEHIYATLKRQSDYYNFHERTLGTFLHDIHNQGWRRTMDDRLMWGQTRMDPTDLADVTGYAYTYLMNGTAPAGNWTGLFRRDERVRLRFINGSSMTFFDVRIPDLKLKVIAADGQDVEPVTVDEFRIGVAEVLDVIVEPKADRPYTIFAQSIDRSGYARGTLAPRAGLAAAVPPLDPRPLLTMADMGMGGAMAGMDVGSMSMSDTKGGHRGASGTKGTDRSMPKKDHDMSDMKAMPDTRHAPHESMPGMKMAGMDMEKGSPVHHAPAEYGPTVDMRALHPESRLDDAGVGLRHNGRGVLTYADLHTLGGSIDAREPGRDVELHLTGHMQRFIWSFNGQKFSQAQPLKFNYGERLRVVLVNDTMMNHPIHLHGMWGEIEDEDGDFLVRKHTITVQPGQRIAYGVTADALGRWAYHCHLLYHMEAGMFREVVVAHSNGRTER
ncbi:MAG: copper resistance system multicopper oxidase [Steroidobacteraceae bacterium]